MPLTAHLPNEAIQLRRSYPTPEDLLLAFNPQTSTMLAARFSQLEGNDITQIRGRIYAIDSEMYRSYLPNSSKSANQNPAPTLALVSRTFRAETAIAWLIAQLHSLAEYAGVKDKFSQEQLQEQAALILSEYYFLRLSELMDFFRLFKLGKFGKFYGNADPLVVTEALSKFLAYRARIIDQLLERQRNERAQRERSERAVEAISFQRYREILAAQGKQMQSEQIINQINQTAKTINPLSQPFSIQGDTSYVKQTKVAQK